jgi:hypothetical protein
VTAIIELRSDGFLVVWVDLFHAILIFSLLFFILVVHLGLDINKLIASCPPPPLVWTLNHILLIIFVLLVFVLVFFIISSSILLIIFLLGRASLGFIVVIVVLVTSASGGTLRLGVYIVFVDHGLGVEIVIFGLRPAVQVVGRHGGG